MWLGEQITDKGIGNGVSLIIMVGIIARLPHALIAEFNTRFTEATGGFVMLVVERPVRQAPIRRGRAMPTRP